MSSPTPGHIAYDAYWPHACVPWYTLHPHWQAAWEAAAQAVLDHAALAPREVRLEEEEG